MWWLFCQDQGQDIIFVLEAPRDQDVGLEDYITAYLYSKRTQSRSFSMEMLILLWLNV